MLLIGASMGLAVQLWLDPSERAVLHSEDRQLLLELIGRVHLGQLVGSVVVIALHWRAVTSSPAQDVVSPKPEEPNVAVTDNSDSSHPGFERQEFVLGGALLNWALLAAEVVYYGSAAAPSWVGRWLTTYS